MSRAAKGSLIHGIINIILPLFVVMFRSGIFVVNNNYNPWKYFYVGIFLALFPIVSSLAGIIISGIMLAKSKEKAIAAGLVLSFIGLVMHIVFRFILKI